MPRPKGSQNKITIQVKEQLQSLIDEVVNSIDVISMDYFFCYFFWKNQKSQF